MDPGTALTILGAAVGGAATGAEIVKKILGPTADYLGVGLKNWTEKRVNNVGRIVNKAQQKLGSRIDDPGSVPPKVLKAILDDGSFCEDTIGTEYFGGVLASSRTENSRDDRAVTYLSLIGRLSTYQIRTHYLLYQLLKITLRDEYSNQMSHQVVTELYIPESVYDEAMDFSESEDKGVITDHSLVGLSKEALINDNYVYGGLGKIQAHSRTPIEPSQFSYRYNIEGVTEGGIVFQPSKLGFELFFWAYGKPDYGYADFLNPEVDFPIIEGVSIKSGAILV
jgi:hypothetical protein